MPTESLENYPRSATRLLVAMSRSTAGRSASRVDTLLTGFGFVKLAYHGIETVVRTPDALSFHSGHTS